MPRTTVVASPDKAASVSTSASSVSRRSRTVRGRSGPSGGSQGDVGIGRQAIEGHQVVVTLGGRVPVGGIFNVCNAKLITWWNTGAATRPPKCPDRGFCRTTSTSSCGLSAGPNPTKDDVYPL